MAGPDFTLPAAGATLRSLPTKFESLKETRVEPLAPKRVRFFQRNFAEHPILNPLVSAHTQWANLGSIRSHLERTASGSQIHFGPLHHLNHQLIVKWIGIEQHAISMHHFAIQNLDG